MVSGAGRGCGDAALRLLDRMWFSTPGTALRGAVSEAADLLSPTWCVGCRAAATVLCPPCRTQLRLVSSHPFRAHPFRAEAPAQALPVIGADSEGLYVLPVISAARYSGLMAEALLAFKDHERTGLLRPLAAGLSRALEEAAATVLEPGPALLVTPPPSLRSVLRRGRHPLGELVAALTLPPGMVLEQQLLQRSDGPRAVLGRGQKARSAAARRRSTELTLTAQARHSIDGTQVLLVDDVLTTGATLAAMYAPLVASGAEVRGAAVLAAAPRPPQDDALAAQQ